MKQPIKGRKQQHPANASAKHKEKISSKKEQPYVTALLAILVISFIAYLPALQNHFVWDDERYIQNDPLIHSLNLQKIFSTYVMGNYHPLTMLTYALEYSFFKLSEPGYHAINILFHLANVVLVFYVILMWSDKVIVALVASLLFGIHPMHAESVAWASQLKDLLYTFFFLASYLSYLYYLKHGDKKFYLYCLILFLFSLLSKAMAASLPAVLILTDYIMPSKERKTKAQLWLEKVPFFVLAVIVGIAAIYAQKSAGAVEAISFPVPQRIVFACYSFILYVLKIILPLHLDPFYAYPVNPGETIPSQYYIYLFLSIALIAYTLYTLRLTKKIAFGIGFFACTVFLVLQLLPVGKAIMADRYSYIPSIGIFYLLAEGFYWLWNKKGSFKTAGIALLVAFSVFFSAKTYAMSEVWRDSKTLWNYVIDQSPDVALGYYNRAIDLKNEGRFDEALADFNMTLKLDSEYTSAYNNRGIIRAMRNNNEDAIKDFTKAIALKPDNAESYANRGISLQNSKRIDEALKDYNKAIELDSTSAPSYYNRAVIEYNAGKKETACMDFGKAAALGFATAQQTYPRLCH